MSMAECHLPHSTVALLLSHVPVDVVARNIQLILVGKGFQVMFSGVMQNSRERRGGGIYLWKVCLLALCLLNTEDVRVLTFDVFHTSILKERGGTIDSTPNSSLLLKPPSCMLP